ncbi:T-lymphocyte surface antigen Ly-9-like [Talpa occidentalis]|uniref:T-lymphocyte surface antigen Ly-9-like n=1 Tax=Talpa occidentalis TaxID=50954 RepID=UPI00188E64A6|nr:T-lymphocyte surface antigen Ly-9-like [Talpa occidentalis]
MGTSLPWSLLLLGFFLGRGASRNDMAPVVVAGILGGSVTLPLQLLPGQRVESVSWKSRSAAKTIATVTLGEAGRPDTFEQIEARYRGRVRAVGPGSSLQISNLSREDAGSYRAHVNLRDSPVTHTWEYRLWVYELVTQPHVKMSSRVGENGHCTTILTCEAEGGGDSVSYSWTPLGPRTVVSGKGSVLSVSSRPGDDVLIFTCVVKNPVSNSSSVPVRVLPSCAERLQKPNITASSLIMENGMCSLTLICSLKHAGEDVQYKWEPQGLGTVVSHGGTTLRVSWKSGSSDSLNCTTRNPVSQSSSSVLASSLCSASFLTCSPEKGFLLFLILGALGI